MLTEPGRVVGLEGETVWVETLRSSACGKCSARAGCGHDLLNRAAPGTSRGIVRARRGPDLAAPLAIDDAVTLSLPETSFLKAASLLYLLPLVAAVVAAGAAGLFLAPPDGSQGAADLAVAGGAAGGLGLGLLGVRVLGKRAGADAGFEPQITAKH